MRTTFNLRNLLLMSTIMLLISCAAKPSNHGTASDRTGTNGATNGTGKVPRG